MPNYDQPHSALDHPAGEECKHHNSTDENYSRGCLAPLAAWHAAQQEHWWREVIAARVRVGALYCDNNAPEYKGYPWFQRVQLGILDMGECDNCVMGHLYGSYESSPMMRHQFNREFGFEVFRGDQWREALRGAGDHYAHPEHAKEYTLLTLAWRKEIMARRDAARIIPDGFTESLGLSSN